MFPHLAEEKLSHSIAADGTSSKSLRNVDETAPLLHMISWLIGCKDAVYQGRRGHSPVSRQMSKPEHENSKKDAA